jgi:glutathione S-transferase
MSELILHHYDASPFTQKAQLMLGIKGLSWYSVETPMIEPKPDLTVLTGGYRGTPVLQIGADVYVDTQCIARELERRFPAPSLFPGANAGLDYALVKWSDAFFRASLFMFIALAFDQWPDDFQKDRRALFDDIDFDDVPTRLDHSRCQLRAHASLVNRQLSDGRAYFHGDEPSLADIQGYVIFWLARNNLQEVNEWFSNLSYVSDWQSRMAAIGAGERSEFSAPEAHAVAMAATTKCAAGVEPGEPLDMTPGDPVVVEPDDSRRGAVQGTLLRAESNRIVVSHANDTVGEVAVHFPRLGYRVKKCTP